MSDLMKVSSNPHVRSKTDTSSIMLTVVIALLPAAGFGIYNFGLDALILILVTVASTVLTELLFEKICKRKITIGDYSAVVTGLLLALNLPASAPWWIGVVSITTTARGSRIRCGTCSESTIWMSPKKRWRYVCGSQRPILRRMG